jgi:[ribosomal protein S5]-alanine N-acetyltransferase
MFSIATSRLDLIPATVAMLEAELASPSAFASLLGATVPDGWPPGEYDQSAISFFLDRVRENPDAVRWYSWYAVLRSENGQKILVGAAGFFGPPDENGQVEIGYSVVSTYEGQGYATEIVQALVQFAFSSGRVKRMIAHTHQGNIGSIRVLAKAGFGFVGTGQEVGVVEYGKDLRV